MNSKSLNRFAGVAALGAGLLVSSCAPGSQATGAATAAGAPARGGGGGRGGAGGAGAVPVITAKAVTKAVPVTIPAVGTVEAVTNVQVRAQVTGQLSSVGFTEGQEVAKGQLLFTIDPRPFQAALAQAQAALARDAALNANQEMQATRTANLFKQGLISRQDSDAQTAAAQASTATLEMDRAAVSTNQLNLQYTRITAPIAGRTGALGVHVGDIVRANDTNPMVVLNQLSPIYVAFSVPGRYLTDIQTYQRQHPLTLNVRMQPNAVPGAQQQAPPSSTPDESTSTVSVGEQGHITFIDNTVDASTGTIKLRGLFQNVTKTLWPGLFVQVTLNLGNDETALVVPAAAVQASQDGQYVYVVKPDRTAEMRPVTVERQQGTDTVITKGLVEGEEVVTDGQLRLAPGTRVSTQGGRGARGST